MSGDYWARRLRAAGVKPTADLRFSLTDLLWSHQVWAFNGTQVACSCDHRFRTQLEQREHLADVLLPVLARHHEEGTGA